MKTFIKPTLFILTTIWGLHSASAQVTMRRSVDGDGAFHLKETQTILTSRDDTVSVLMVLPKKLRPEGYADVTLMENDKILMVNAKRVKTVQQFEEIYNGLEIGQTLKMGIQRNGQLLIESFSKIDPEKMPKGQNIMVQSENSGGAHAQDGMVFKGVVTDDSASEDDLRPWFGTGLMLGLEGDKVTVMQKMAGMKGALSQFDIKEGDEIKSLNGKKVESLDKFLAAYEEMEIGSQVELEYARSGKQMKVTFQKPKVRGNVRIRREN